MHCGGRQESDVTGVMVGDRAEVDGRSCHPLELMGRFADSYLNKWPGCGKAQDEELSAF